LFRPPRKSFDLEAGADAHTGDPLGLLAAFSLVGTSRRRAPLSIGAALALLALVALYARAGVFFRFYQGDWSFWSQIISSYLVLILVGAYFVAIGFALAGKRRTASIIALSTLPWAAAILKRSGFEIIVRRRDDSQ
jgi:hypothetical protein